MIFAISAILLLLFVILLSLFYVQQQLTEVLRTVRIDEQIEANLLAFQSNIKDAETGQRGYLLTANPDYLTPYNRAIANSTDYLSTTVDLMEPAPSLVDDLTKLEQLGADKLAELRQTIELHDAGQPEAAIALVNTDIGKLKMDSIQQLVTEVIEDRRVARETRDQKLIRLLSTNRTVVAISAVLLFALLTYVLFQVKPIIDKVNEQNVALHRQHALLKVKNRELEHFAYITSHDLKEPLRTINGFINVLEEDYRDNFDQEGERLFDYIRAASLRMDGMIHAILSYSKLGSSEHFGAVDLNRVLREVKDNLAFAIGESQAILSVQELPTVVAKESLIGLVFQNLLANAIKFRRPGVVPDIRIGAEEQRTHWTFTVADNGIGIPADKRGEVFNFFTKLHLSSEYEGQGIGLSFCQKIVEIHGGTIWVTSREGQGSTFTFTIAKDLRDADGQ